MSDDQVKDYGEVELEEIDEAIFTSESLSNLKKNLQNIQAKNGRHKPLFEQNTKTIIDIIEEIQAGIEDGISFYALEPRFNDLPNGVEEMARYHASKHYESPSLKRPELPDK